MGIPRRWEFHQAQVDVYLTGPATELFMRRDEAKSVLDSVVEFRVRMHWPA